MDDNTNTNDVVEVVADEPQATPEVVEAAVAAPAEEAPAVAEPTPEPEAPVADEEPAPPSRREQLRIQDLLKKYGPPQERTAPTPKNSLDYASALDADPEVIKQLEADRTATSQASFDEGYKRAEFSEWKMGLKIDAPNVVKKYPILDPKSDEFHPAVADAMNQWYLKMSGFNPESQTIVSGDISYADFVESNMELVEEIAGAKHAQTVKNVAKQTAQTAIRPDGSSAPRMNLNKAPQDMTMEELYATMGQKPPTKT